MIKFENTEVLGWEHAIRGMGKCYRKRDGKYECYIKEQSKCVYLGTYEKEEDAVNVIYEYRKNRLLKSIRSCNLKIEDSKIYANKYVVFNNSK